MGFICNISGFAGKGKRDNIFFCIFKVSYIGLENVVFFS